MSDLVMTLAVPDRTGASRMQSYFARKLLERGHSVRLLHGTPAQNESGEWSLLEEQREAGVETIEVPLLRRPVPYISYGKITTAAAGADGIIAVNQRDRAAAMAAASRMGIPGIVCAQNQHNFWGRALLPKIKHAYYGRRLREGLTLAVCTSDVVRDQLVDIFAIDAANCAILPNGIPVSAETVERDQRPSGPVQFVSVGRLDQQKGYDVLIEAWNKADLAGRAFVRVVGGITPGNSESLSRAHAEELRTRIAELGLQDQIILEGSQDDVPSFLTNADAYVHSARWEGPALPLAIMEAMDKALPIAMTDCSGWPDGFEAGKQGFVVASEDADALAGALTKIVAMSVVERDRMGQASRELLLERYDIEAIGSRFVDLVEGVL